MILSAIVVFSGILLFYILQRLIASMYNQPGLYVYTVSDDKGFGTFV